MRSTIVPIGTDTFAPARNMREKWRTVAVRSAAGPTMKPGRVAEGQHGQLERVAELQEARGLVGAVRVDRTAEVRRVVGDDAERASVHARERGHHAGAEAVAQLEHRALVEERVDHAPDLVDALALLGDQLAQQRLVGGGGSGVAAGR